MNSGLAILGIAAIALYFVQNNKKKIEDELEKLKKDLAQNQADDVKSDLYTQDTLDKILSPYEDENNSGIEVFPYAMFTHMGGTWENNWYGKVVWEIRNKSGHQVYIKGIMSNLRLCGYLCSFLPSNNENFPVKLENGDMIDPGCTWQAASWLPVRAQRDKVRNSMPQKDTDYPILECDAVIEIQNPYTLQSNYISFRAVKGVAVWRSSNNIWPGVGEDATDDSDWARYIEVLGK